MNKDPLFIILADDDEADRLLFSEVFSELTIKNIVITVNNGVELMRLLKEEKALLPHLIFLDLNMPGKNGLQCLKEIRSSKKLKNISVAIYSTSDQEKDIEETFLNGANIYITKPSDYNILKRMLEKAVVTAYHYEEGGLNKENFLLKI